MKEILTIILSFFVQYSYCQLNCNNWLKTPSTPSSVRIGQLNITGNQMTIEAVINRTTPYYNGQVWAGDVVSKHRDPTDANYILRPNSGEITTSNGYYKTPDITDITLNTTHHVAMVYDGASLKFYRDGCLMSQIAASGPLVQNSWEASIGFYSPQLFPDENFTGYINEVRIWKVARTQDQLRSYMNTSLPSPSTQTGLLAYYTFDNLLNKQGNPSWNGTLNGSASINQANPACAPVPDLCAPINTDSVVVNNYTPVTSFDICKNELTVSDASRFNVGDTVLLIQMKGADIDSSNSPTFGTIINYNSAGNFEFNIVNGKSGNKIILLNNVSRKYDIPNGKVQLVRVPYFENLSNTAVLTCLPWDGEKGGVVAFNVKGTFNMGADVDATGKGFRHGPPLNSTLVTLNEQAYYYDASVNKGGAKGEGITMVSPEKSYGRGAMGNGGGGGNAHNCGGGGGGNGGAGGTGGDQWETGKTIAEMVGGLGGKTLSNSSTLNKLFLGGSGGMGHANNQREYPAGNGGGIIIFSAGSVVNTTHQIKANGANAIGAPNSEECKDGMAGGGGAGTISINAGNILGNLNIEAKGGKGADHIADNVMHGPGGGGGGGVVCLAQSSVSPLYSITVAGGSNGVNVNHGNNPYGATAGSDGIIITDFKQTADVVLFKKNIDSIRIANVLHDCRSIDFDGWAYYNNSPIETWKWDLGDGTASSEKNLVHQYAFGNYDVKLLGFDINGCSDSFHIPVKIKDINLAVREDTSLCGPGNVKLFATGGDTYSWSPASSLTDVNIAGPTAFPTVSTKYFVIATDKNGCSKKDSINIIVNDIPTIAKSNDTTICNKTTVRLYASGGNSYHWSPASSLDNSELATPIASPKVNTTYLVKVFNSAGCSKLDSVKVEINPIATISISNDTTICKNGSARLFVTGGNSFLWSPSATLSDPTISSPVASPLINTTYSVEIKDQYECLYKDSVTVAVHVQPVFSVSPSQAVCSNESVQLTASGGDEFIWTPVSFLTSGNISNPESTPDSSVTYTVLIRENVCKDSAKLTTRITVLPKPVLLISKSNDITCTKPSASLVASGAYTYSWLPAGSLNFPNVSSPIASPKTTTVYSVTGIDKNGCKNSDTISVKVDFDGNVFYGLPNSFTPNGDGLNDCFGVSKWGAISQLDLSIYNRFGQRIFHTTNPKVCWDGTFKGEPQNNDVYVYTVTATVACGKINKKGTVSLLR